MLKQKNFLASLILCFAFLQPATAQELPADAVRPDWQSEVPMPVHPDTALVSLYYKTWETAAGRVRRGPEGLPASPYLDENCYEDEIWIWDSSFMVMFSKYAPKAFPGKETLLNCYMPIHDHVKTPLHIHLRDNPPIFAWVEHDNYLFTGDSAQIDLVLRRKQYLQKHYDFFNTVPKGNIDTIASPAYSYIERDVVRDNDGNIIGYTWSGNASGMDNCVRGRDAGGGGNVLWVDAIAQQALSALSIARLCRLTGENGEAARWQAEYERLKKTINERYWDERDGYYYDIDARTGEPCRIMTPASFWVMLAEVPDSSRAARMMKYLEDERYMGGKYPWNSLARTDMDFNAATGDYWRGGIWLPIAYMGTKALEKYGYHALADTLAERVVRQQLRTYHSENPHTIWECYSPSADEPSTEHGHRARGEFCGWSALGPISLFIENIMGFRQANALTRNLQWSLKTSNGTHGLKRLRFGDVETDIIYNADKHRVEIKASRPYTLTVNKKNIRVKAGTHKYKVPRIL